MFRFFIIIGSILLVVIASIAGIIWLSLESRPSVTTHSIQYLNNADQMDSLIAQVNSALENNQGTSKLVISEIQLESLQGLLQRASEKLAADAFIRESGTVISLTMRLEYKEIKRYLNAHIWVTSGNGFPIQKVKIGRVLLSGNMAKSLVKYIVNFYTNSKVADAFFNSVTRVTMNAGNADIELSPMAPFIRELKQIKVKRITPKAKNREKYTALFLRALENYDIQYGDTERSLNEYLRVVFREAEKQEDEQDAAMTNEAAILSLAIFIGDPRFALFAGDVHLDPLAPSTPKIPPTLAGRNDLARHFVISAALEIVSRRGFALAVGEYKELLNRAKGQSGFSFADLTADRAGVQFANEATNPAKAWLVQQRLVAGITERAYFPTVDGLEEGISKRSFTGRFKQVDSQAYKKQINSIKGKIKRLYLYSI